MVEYIVISFPNNVIVGGLGDRIVGLISCHMMAKLLGKRFCIHWTKENIKPYINYSRYDINNIKPNVKFDFINSIDNQKKLKNILIKKPKPFKNILLLLNQEISQYLYANPYYCRGKDFYLKEILNSYQLLWNEILKPTPFLQNKINNIIGNTNKPIIGIQIRAGDKYMITNLYENYSPIKNPVKKIPEILISIKNHIENTYPPDSYLIFITSDYNPVAKICKTIWNPKNIKYDPDIVQHIDRKNVKNDFSKIFTDSIILSQYTSSIYISDYSNFGRIAALSAKHSNIFNTKCISISKSSLVSKHEKLFCD